MSLKWRIALGYSLLLIVAITAMSGIIAWRFQQILYDQAQATVNATMRGIVQFAEQSATPFSLEESNQSTLQFLFNSSNLATWNSENSYVQVDSREGYPLAKTANLGALTIPSNPRLTPMHDVAYRQVTLGGRPFFVEDRYLQQGGNAAVIHVAEPLDTLQRTFVRAREAIFIVLGATSAAVVIFSIVLASQVTTPIDELSREMREISSDRLALAGALDGRRREPELEHRRDEIGRLAKSFTDLLARLAEAFARERQFISDASHELKTPLTSINANAQLLLRWGDSDRNIRRESLETIARESADLAGMVNGMLTLAKADRGDEIPKEPLSLAQIASEVTVNAAPRAAEKQLELNFSHDGTPIVYGDAHLLRQMVGNLVDNAIKFSSEGGSVDVRVGENNSSAWIDVADSGPGIADEEQAHIFERFYRADKARSRSVPGTGLGLAIVRSIARVHGGEASARRGPNGGALLHVVLPRVKLPFTDLS
jgi:two-component system, OmpR family, sensor histidine kinase ArlS